MHKLDQGSRAGIVVLSAWACRSSDVQPRSPGAATERLPHGTYERRLCRWTCDSAHQRNNIRSGWGMLDSAAIDPAAFPDSIRRELEISYMFLRRDGPPNSCFVLRVDRADVETYAGIVRGGLTRWALTAAGDSLEFSLYRSPDADHEVRAALTTRGFEGRGKSWRVGAAEVAYPYDLVVGRCLGPADADRCREAALAARAAFEEWRRQRH